MPFFRQILSNHPVLKKNLKSMASLIGLRRQNPIAPFFVDLKDVSDRGGDDFSKLFYGYDGGSLVHKWNHFLPIYSRLFEPYRNGTREGRPVRFLEIGVSEGGSLDIWRRYFGETAIIYGIDVDPKCGVFDGKSAQVRIGSQADPDFLTSVVREMGGIDIVLDDGSHFAAHQRISFETLFPLLPLDGLYVVEDIHSAYWREYQGGFRRKGSFIEITKHLIDDIHHWYHNKPKLYREFNIGAIHIFDSIIAFEKTNDAKPFHTTVGRPTK